MRIFSTKSYFNLACAHAQYFDEDEDGSPGACASLHGYDRSVHFLFTGTPDEQGWIFPFGKLKAVKEFLEYYFDHTSLLPANDPRLNTIPFEMLTKGGIIGTLRVLPYGVSMEMSSMFIWEQVNAYIYKITEGRVCVAQVEVKEHERNSGIFKVTEHKAKNHGRQHFRDEEFLIKKPIWEYETPADAWFRLNN